MEIYKVSSTYTNTVQSFLRTISFILILSFLTVFTFIPSLALLHRLQGEYPEPPCSGMSRRPSEARVAQPRKEADTSKGGAGIARGNPQPPCWGRIHFLMLKII